MRNIPEKIPEISLPLPNGGITVVLAGTSGYRTSTGTVLQCKGLFTLAQMYLSPCSYPSGGGGAGTASHGWTNRYDIQYQHSRIGWWNRGGGVPMMGPTPVYFVFLVEDRYGAIPRIIIITWHKDSW